ncbi:MAG TPA: hypothetical protein VMT03_11065 [Polyangia bacterium]|nr:hypothetical protein [Polyangia bacterium]
MRSFGVAAGAWLAVALVGPAAHAQSVPISRPKVIVVDAVDLPDSLADIRANLRGALENAVSNHDYDLGPDGGACPDRECVKVAATQSGATDVLIATGGRNEMRGYHIELRVWNVASDREDHAVAECNVCAALQMVETVKGVAGALLDRIPTLHANLAVVIPPPPPPAPVVIETPPPPPSKGRKIAGWTLVGLGFAGAAASAILFTIDGNNTSCASSPPDYIADPCAATRHTIVPASIIGGAALASVVAGVVLIQTGGNDHKTLTVSASPFGLALGGRL